MKSFFVLVPKPGTRPAAWIAQGSGIVTDDLSRDRYRVYFEGNLYGASNIVTFEDKLFQAAGRLDAKYPTVAMGVWSSQDFEIVGQFTASDDWKNRKVVIYSAMKPIVEAWIQCQTQSAPRV